MRLALLLAILLLWPAYAHAGTVAIVRLSSPPPRLTETLSRLHGELLSVGLEVKIIDRPANRGPTRADSTDWLQGLAAADGLDAVIEIVGDVAQMAVDVWVIQKSPRRIEVSRVSVEATAENASEQLAIRAVELLRSTFLEHDMAARERPREPVTQPAPPTPPPVERHTSPPRLERFGVELGAAVLTGLNGVGPAFLPVVRLDWAVRPWFVLQTALAGLGGRATVATSVGDARIAQRYAILGGYYRFRPDEPLQPFVSLSTGVLHTSVDGRADPPRQGHAVTHWSFMLEGGVGVLLRLPERYFSSLSGHVQLAETYAAIHFMDAVVATTGRPNLVMSLSVGAWL